MLFEVCLDKCCEDVRRVRRSLAICLRLKYFTSTGMQLPQPRQVCLSRGADRFAGLLQSIVSLLPLMLDAYG